MEEWQQIPNYRRYEISTNGIIRNIQRKTLLKINTTKYKNTNSYIQISLINDQHKRKKPLLHRLVAITYLENTLAKPEINHIDGDKYNNSVYNLEWCTRQENMDRIVSNKQQNTSRRVLQYDLENNFIKEFQSIKQAEEELDILTCTISACCIGRVYTAGGYIWKYKHIYTDIEWVKMEHFTDYEISDKGMVRNKHTKRVLKGMANNEYLCINLYINQKRTKHYIHRLVATHFINNPDNLSFVDHIDTYKQNNTATNLRWCTRSENMKNIQTQTKVSPIRSKFSDQEIVDAVSQTKTLVEASKVLTNFGRCTVSPQVVSHWIKVLEL